VKSPGACEIFQVDDLSGIAPPSGVPLMRQTLSITLLLALLLAPCLNACGGWTASADHRMACCIDKGGHHTQMQADACCAMGESRQNVDRTGFSVPALLVSVQAVTQTIAVMPTTRDADFAAPSPDAFAPHTDRHVLLSVFLI
jgi:hypothetical protein